MYELIKAIMNDDHDKTDNLIKSNPELVLKLTEKEGVTFVALAIGKGNTKLVSRLIELGAPFKAPLDIGPIQKFTPLVLAILCEQIEIIKILLKAGANINDEIVRSKYNTKKMSQEIYNLVKPFIDMVDQKGDVQKEKESMEIKNHEIKSNSEKTKDNSAQMRVFSHKIPLFFAIDTNNLEIIKLLLESGANPLHETSERLNSFIYVIQRKNNKIVELIANYIDNPNHVFESETHLGLTPLYLAAHHGLNKVIKCFIDKGAKINKIITKGPMQGYFPIFSAVYGGHYETVEMLLAAGADIHQAVTREGDETTPLVTAISRQHFNIVKLLIEKGKADYRSALKAGETYLGTTPLHYAIAAGNLEIVKYLIANGCDCNQVVTEGPHEGDVPLSFAIRQNQPLIIQFLLDNGADYKKILMHNQKDAYAYYLLNVKVSFPLDELFLKGHWDIAKKVLNEDRDLYAPLPCSSEQFDGINILYLVLQSGNKALIQFFLKESKFDINKKMEKGRFKGLTTLEIAVKLKNTIVIEKLKDLNVKFNEDEKYFMFGSLEEVKLLLKYDFMSCELNYTSRLKIDDANVQQEQSKSSPYMMITKSNKADKVILMCSADVNRLLYAILGKNIEVLQLLPKHKIDKPLVSSEHDMEYPAVLYNTPEKKQVMIASGVTPLFLAAEFGHIEVIEYLIKNKASINQRLNSGKFKKSTALHGAVLGNQLQAVELLIKHGASPLCMNNDSKTPKELALSLGYHEIAKLLEQYEVAFNNKIQSIPEKSVKSNISEESKKSQITQETKPPQKPKVDRSPVIIETPDPILEEIRELKRRARALKDEKVIKTKKNKEPESTPFPTNSVIKKNKEKAKDKKSKKSYPLPSESLISTQSSQVLISKPEISSEDNKIIKEKPNLPQEKFDPSKFNNIDPIIHQKKILSPNDLIDPKSETVIVKEKKKKNNIKSLEPTIHSPRETGIIETIIHYEQSISACLFFYKEHRIEENKEGLIDLREIIHKELSWLLMRLFESLSQYNNLLKKLHETPLPKDFIKGIHIAITLRNRIRYLNKEISIDDLINFGLVFKGSVAPNIKRLKSIAAEDKIIGLEKLENTALFVNLNTVYKMFCKNLRLKRVQFNTLTITRESFEEILSEAIAKFKKFTKHFTHKADSNSNVHHISACNFLIDTIIRNYLALTNPISAAEKSEHKLFSLLEKYSKLRNTMGHALYESEYDEERHIYLESIEPLTTYEITTNLIEQYEQYKKDEDDKKSQQVIERNSFSNKDSTHTFFGQNKTNITKKTDESMETRSTQTVPLDPTSKPFVPEL